VPLFVSAENLEASWLKAVGVAAATMRPGALKLPLSCQLARALRNTGKQGRKCSRASAAISEISSLSAIAAAMSIMPLPFLWRPVRQ
jgi:hypothetical protein